MEQVQLKFGKPGVHPSEVYEEAVASNFEELMNDNDKKTGGVYTAPDNALLIRFRVLCFVKQKLRSTIVGACQSRILPSVPKPRVTSPHV
jgi:hypothetical protein